MHADTPVAPGRPNLEDLSLCVCARVYMYTYIHTYIYIYIYIYIAYIIYLGVWFFLCSSALDEGFDSQVDGENIWGSCPNPPQSIGFRLHVEVQA